MLIQAFDIAENTRMLPIVLHQNNLRPMYETWMHGEQAKWWTQTEWFSGGQFWQTRGEMGVLYKMTLRASGKQGITVAAVAVAAIYKLPSATCLQIITWRFLQTREATDWDLHRPRGVIDISIGMDYPFLLPRHLEQEMSWAPCTSLPLCLEGD